MLKFSVIAPNIDPLFVALKAPLKDFSLPASQFPDGLWVALDRSLGNAVRDNISQGGWGPHGAFAAPAPGYAKAKAHAGHGGEPILVFSGRLMRSFEAAGGSGDHVFEQSPMTMRIGSSLSYALHRQTGFDTRLGKGGRGKHPQRCKPKPAGMADVPARRPLDPGGQEKANWRTLMARYVTQRYRAAGWKVLGADADVGEAKAAGQVFYAMGGTPGGLPLSAGI